VVAVKAALRNRTGVWFGWSGKIDGKRHGDRTYQIARRPVAS
jgi:hypothetical protein